MANISNIKLPDGSVYGFNSSTVNNKNIEMSVYSSLYSFGCSSTDTAQTIWNKLPDRSIYIDVAANLVDDSWIFPVGVSQHTIMIIKISKQRLGGIYLCPKTNGDIYWCNVDSSGEFAGNWRKISNEIKKVEITASTNDNGVITLPNNSVRTYISVVSVKYLSILFNEPNSGGQKFLVVNGNFEKKTNFSLTFTAYYIEN